MWMMVVSGIISLVFGMIFLLFPTQLRDWSQEMTRRLARLDPTVLDHRVGTGLCLMSSGVFCLASAYYVWLRLHS